VGVGMGRGGPSKEETDGGRLDARRKGMGKGK